jgi:hypothetical protein
LRFLIRRFDFRFSLVVRTGQFDWNVPRSAHNDWATVWIKLDLAPESLQEQKKFFGKHVRNLVGRRISGLVGVDGPEVQSLLEEACSRAFRRSFWGSLAVAACRSSQATALQSIRTERATAAT